MVQGFGSLFAREANMGARVHLLFGSADEPSAAHALPGTAGNTPYLGMGTHTVIDDLKPGAAGAAQEDAITFVEIYPIRYAHYRFETGPMHAPMQALRECTDDLIRRWGYDPSVVSTALARPQPLTPPGLWVRSEDYPRNMLDKGTSAVITFRVDVDAKGAVTGCHVAEVTQGPGFAELTCKLVKARAKFKPALGANGKPIPMYFATNVMWVVEGSTKGPASLRE